MNNLLKPLITVLVFLAGLLYMGSIIWAGIISLRGNSGVLHPYFSNAVIIISGILSTNFGAVLGITLTPPQSAAKDQRAPRFLGLRSTFQASRDDGSVNPTDQNQKFQILACWIYVIALMIAFTFWIVTIIRGTEQQAVPLLAELSKALLGVVAGVMVVRLGRTTN